MVVRDLYVKIIIDRWLVIQQHQDDNNNHLHAHIGSMKEPKKNPQAIEVCDGDYCDHNLIQYYIKYAIV